VEWSGHLTLDWLRLPASETIVGRLMMIDAGHRSHLPHIHPPNQTDVDLQKQFVDVLEPKKTTTYYILSKSIANTIDAKISN